MCNYVFLTNQYLPKPGATGLCVHQIAKTLVVEGENVFTICYEDGDISNEYDGVNVIKIRTPLYLKDSQSASYLKRKIQYSISLWNKLIHIGQYPLRSNRLVDNYIKEIEKVLNMGEPLIIIASYTPLEAVVAAAKIKNRYPKLVKCVYYSTDTLSNEQGENGILLAEYRTAAGVKWEKKLFRIFDRIFIMECHENHYMSDDFSDFKSKFEVVNFPLMIKKKNTHVMKKRENKRIQLVYAGTLYQKLRNPRFLLNTLIDVSKVINIEVTILGGGDCEELLKSAEIESNGTIKYLGMQSYQVAMKYIYEADILLSIGNIESPMAPSKIYEYMSTGKPIIHTYTYEKDPCLCPLKEYKNALLINELEMLSLQDVVSFVKNPIVLDYEEIEDTFILATPKYTINCIKKLEQL